ncbi:LOW QUALITY PROTEIN: hypothetical protein KIPB_002605 [Kipferlia bialata]|uniref:Kelch-type beta propeller n=1 Tax=Kipferlia bialata TaxID=797122 RepID=A0A9K3CSP8_9EUKA|nr:LOW QUALITY PROTEIN: hypothetical protein KIPB_002605 [Kipferlia bialata]
MDFSEWYTSSTEVLQDLKDWWRIQLVSVGDGVVLLSGMTRGEGGHGELERRSVVYLLLTVDSHGTIAQEAVTAPPLPESEQKRYPNEDYDSPRDRYNTTLSAGGGRVYAVHYTLGYHNSTAGWGTSSWAHRTLVYSLDMASLLWHEVEQVVTVIPPATDRDIEKQIVTPTPRIKPICTCVDGTLMLIGGKRSQFRSSGYATGRDRHAPESGETLESSVEALDPETERWAVLVPRMEELDSLKLSGGRACVAHRDTAYVRGSGDIWLLLRQPSPGSILSSAGVFSLDRPIGFLPRSLVSVGKYILMLPDTDYADRAKNYGDEGVYTPMMWDPISDDTHLCKGLPGMGCEYRTGCMLTATTLLVVSIRGCTHTFRVLTLAPEMVWPVV